MKPLVFSFALLVLPFAVIAAPVDPWSFAPAIPTACFSGEDGFFERATAQIEKIKAAENRQEAINQEIKDRSEAVDPMEKQSRMMEYMLEHPEDFKKFMEASVPQGRKTDVATTAAVYDERVRQKRALDALIARYEAALKAATRPHYEKYEALPLCDGECASPPWAIEAAKGLFRQIDQEYVKLCDQWWKTGPFHSWFAGYRKLLIASIPAQEEIDASTRASNAMLGITGDYHSTEPLEGVEEYTSLARDLFSKRNAGPNEEYNRRSW